MAGITSDQWAAIAQEYRNALTAVLNGQSYDIGNRKLTRANLKDIQDGLNHADRMAKKTSTSSGGFPVRGITPVDG